MVSPGALALICLGSSMLVAAQTAAGQGIRAPWDFEKTLQALVDDAARLRPVIEQVKPKEWKEATPDAYVNQQQLVLAQLRSVAQTCQQLQKDPERLSIGLDLFFRLESLELNLESFSDGVRRYHNRAVSELIDGMRSQGAAARAGLRDYVVDLAATKEQEFKIVDSEAQKCRSQQLRGTRKRP